MQFVSQVGICILSIKSKYVYTIAFIQRRILFRPKRGYCRHVYLCLSNGDSWLKAGANHELAALCGLGRVCIGHPGKWKPNVGLVFRDSAKESGKMELVWQYANDRVGSPVQ